MSNLAFLESDFLYFLEFLAVCLLVLAFVYLKRWRKRLPYTIGSRYPLIGRMRLLGLLFVSSLITLAIARPLDKKGIKTKEGSIDVVVALDVSLSMRAKDINTGADKARRLDLAKREALRLIGDNILKKGDRVGFFIFGKISSAILPLSDDFGRFVTDVSKTDFPQNLRDESFWDTDIVLALQHIYEIINAQDEFNRKENPGRFGSNPPRIIIIFTDGDYEISNRSLLNRAVGLLKEQGIKIYVIGVGSRQGVSWMSLLEGYQPDVDYPASYTDGWEGGITTLNTETLNHLAVLTQGEVYTIDSFKESASEFLKRVINDNRGIVVKTGVEKGVEFWWYVVLAAYVVLLIAILIY